MSCDCCDDFQQRAILAERRLHSQALVFATLRSAAKTLLYQCACRGSGKIRKQKGFFTIEVECLDCVALREALSTGEIV